MDQRKDFAIPITCPHCGTEGVIVWQENRYITPTGPQRLLAAVHGKFHPETGRTTSGDPLIVCDVCDQIQPD